VKLFGNVMSTAEILYCRWSGKTQRLEMLLWGGLWHSSGSQSHRRPEFISSPVVQTFPHISQSFQEHNSISKGMATATPFQIYYLLPWTT
jgi:hypothetical protein